MARSMALFFAHKTPHRQRRGEQGYILITMLLVVSLLAIAAVVALPSISFTIRRDREQEMVHRGVQYTRAIRAYYKKFGRYPTRLEDLDNTNNLRFLRKHYKDPITGKDFKLLHYGEPGVTLAGGIAGGLGGGSIPGANPVGASGGLNGSNGFSQSSSSFGGTPTPLGGNGNNSFGGNSNLFNGPGTFGSGSGSNSNQNSNSSTTNQNSNTPNSDSSTDSSQTSSSSPGSSSKAGVADDSSPNQLVASGPIVGVASTSKKTTIREYNKKKKYNEWQFLYDPSMDRGGLITTPYQPSLQGVGMGQGFTPVQGMQPGNASSPFAQPTGLSNQPSSFGNQSSPFGSSPNSNQPAPPSNPPQQQ